MQAPGRGLTGRAAVLALVVVALALTLAYPLRSYVGQRSDIAALREQVSGQEAQVEALERARARWGDQAYVVAQARERLHYSMPGETQYVVLEPDEAPAAPADRRGAGPTSPWFSELWSSAQRAAQAPGSGGG